ncbi:hypothetical protein [Kineococcus indalonis]|uniref:hypothetical protein n=1 Tax=Kineococcus indalonis TaxID=2696566 RepID=UPI0014125F5A|nr:hypothetical protein [Kineococcus indalonis]
MRASRYTRTTSATGYTVLTTRAASGRLLSVAAGSTTNTPESTAALRVTMQASSRLPRC